MTLATCSAVPDWMATLVTGQSALTLPTLPAVVLQMGHHSAQK